MVLVIFCACGGNKPIEIIDAGIGNIAGQELATTFTNQLADGGHYPHTTLDGGVFVLDLTLSAFVAAQPSCLSASQSKVTELELQFEPGRVPRSGDVVPILPSAVVRAGQGQPPFAWFPKDAIADGGLGKGDGGALTIDLMANGAVKTFKVHFESNGIVGRAEAGPCAAQ